MIEINFKLVALLVLIGLTACAPKATVAHCNISDLETYKSLTGSEGGMGGPNAAGQEAFQTRIVGVLPNRRKSEFGFKYKGKVLKGVQCKTEKIACSKPSATWCQAVKKCTITLDSGAGLNVIDTPKSDFYAAQQPTYYEWDGKTLKCGPA